MYRNHSWFHDNPIGDPIGGPAYGKYQDPSTIGLIGSGLGAYLGYQGAQGAAGQLIGASNAANATLGSLTGQAIGAQTGATGLAGQLVNPAMQTGNYAQQALAQGLGLPQTPLPGITLPGGGSLPGTQALGAPGAGSPLATAFTPFSYGADQFQSSPGYQFALQQGLGTIQNNAAAKGMLLSPNTIKDLSTYATGVANQDYQQQYQNAYQAYTQNQSNVLNALNAQAGRGTAATNQLVGDITQSGSNIANLLSSLGVAQAGNQLSAGSAAAAGRVGATNALTGGLGNLGNVLTAGRYANTANNLFGGGMGTYGDLLSSISPGAAGGLGDMLGMSIGGTYGPATQAGLDALIGSFSGGSGAAAGAGTAGAAGAAGAEGAGAAAGAAGAGAGAEGAGGAAAGLAGAALPVATALPFLAAAYGMFTGLTGRGDNGTPLTNMQDLYSTALATNPSLINQYPNFNSFVQTNFGGNPSDPGQQYTWDQYNYAKRLLNAPGSPGTLLAGVLGGNDA